LGSGVIVRKPLLLLPDAPEEQALCTTLSGGAGDLDLPLINYYDKINKIT
jgi:hypothetical protein